MADNQEHVLVVTTDPQMGATLDRVLRSADYSVTLTQDGGSAVKQVTMIGASIVILGDRLRDGLGIDCAAEFARRLPAIPVLLYLSQETSEGLKRAMHAGVSDIIYPPLKADDIQRAVRSALDASKRRKDTLLLEARRFTSSLQRQVDEMETLTRLGRQITSTLNIDSVLSSIVDAAVQLTDTEEGSLLLVDEPTGELYMRASKNFQEDFIRTFRLPITDSLAGQVIRTGEAILFDESQPQKIKTSYLVQSLLYVPLQMHGHVLGVLGVDNRHSRLPLTQRHVTLLNALSSYAVIALENARLYTDATNDRNKLETILTEIHDGVVVVDQDQRLGMVNQAARTVFGIEKSDSLAGKPYQDVFPQEEMLGVLNAPDNSLASRSEVTLDENHVFNIMATPIEGVGSVVTLHDITNLKKLDRIKTDFVHTVSHDLRSPLTAILGYVELIERAGTVTDLQRDFIRRIQVSVHNITRLVDDLLDLGRIESGFDVRRESVRLDQIVHYSAEGHKKHLAEKGLRLQINVPPDIPLILANPVQMRQMVDHLLDNAIKYTPLGGAIAVGGRVEQDQIILQFADTGIGIPAIDLPYIFEKFYRAANASSEMSGTGLGLAIVKSIVENHGGRVWVESNVGKGTIFTIVLPLNQP
jgi:two-component system, OmpR family, phosphate regulon sensor histidine kinase PhoR